MQRVTSRSDARFDQGGCSSINVDLSQCARYECAALTQKKSCRDGWQNPWAKLFARYSGGYVSLRPTRGAKLRVTGR